MIHRLLKFIFDHKYISLALAIVLCLAGIIGGPKLPIRLSLAELLPEDRTSVVQMRNVADHVGGVGFLVLLIGPTENPVQYLDQLAEKLPADSERIKYLFYEREEYSLKDKALYLLPKKDFRQLKKNIRILFNDGKNPLGLGLSDSETRKRRMQKAEDFFEELHKNTSSDQYYVSKDKRYAMLLMKPTFNSEDLKNSRRLINHTKHVADHILPKVVPYNLVGRFADKVRDTRQIQDDMAKTGVITAIALTIILIWGLGSFRAAYVTMGGVLLSMGWTIGLAKYAVGQINILTGFLLAILGGLGVEYGVHLIRRYEQERMRGASHEDALFFTHSQMGRTLFSAALTSSSAFFILAISDFRGFSELGIIAGFGILSIYFTYILTFPFFGRFLRKHARFARTRKVFGWYPITKKWALPLVLLTIVIVSGIRNTEFEYDFARMHRLSKKSTELNELSNELFEKSLTPAALLATSHEQAVEVRDWLNRPEHQRSIQHAVSIEDLVPTDMKSRHRQIRKLKKHINNVSKEEIEEKTGISFDQIKRWLDHPTYSEKDLPVQFQSTFGSDGRVVFAFPQESLNHADTLRRFTGILEEARLKFSGLQIGSDAMVFMEILDHIVKDGKIVLLLFLLGSFIVFWLDFRTIRGALILEGQLILGSILLLGLTGLIGERFSIINVAVIPAVLAAGVDMGVHVRHRQLEGFSALSSARFIAQAVQLSVITTMIGFAALFFAEAGILRGIAWVSILGQSAMYLVCMVLVPVFREYLRTKKRKRIKSKKLQA